MKNIIISGLLLVCFVACNANEKPEIVEQKTMICTRETPYENAFVSVKANGDDITEYIKEITLFLDGTYTEEEILMVLSYLQELADAVKSAEFEYRFDGEENIFWYKQKILFDEEFKSYDEEHFSNPEDGTTFYYSLETLKDILVEEGGYVCEIK